MEPDAVGDKFIEYTQETPGANVTGLDEPLRIGQVVKLPRLKLAGILGLLPEVGVGKISGPVPLFWTVTVCGLSLLVAPTDVDAKLSAGATAGPTSSTWPARLSAT
jgi:hypothetical protein